jgi:glycolate oxidase FAD binding subunit
MRASCRSTSCPVFEAVNAEPATLEPRDTQDVAAAVAWALGAKRALRITARGTKQALGSPVSAQGTLDISRLSGIVSYEPGELVLTARAATPLEEIEAALASHRQHLAFEPPKLGAMLDGASAAGTLGGVVAVGLSGPRRFKAGAVRDHVLGIAGVSGRGESFVAGGKVVKNVTGYDLPKLMTGSYGTLAVLTEITLKVLPAPEDVRTLLVLGLRAREAVKVMTEALQSAAEVSGACHLPAGLVVPGKPASDAATALRLEGVGPSVESRMSQVRERLHRAGAHVLLDREASLALWAAVRDLSPFAGPARRGIVWRLSVPPAASATVAERIEQAVPHVQLMFDWGGGLIWVRLPDESDARAEAIRGAIDATGGHATLMRAPEPVRAATGVFHPQPEALAALSRRVKKQFDPEDLLNRGRMFPAT